MELGIIFNEKASKYKSRSYRYCVIDIRTLIFDSLKNDIGLLPLFGQQGKEREI